MRLYLLRFGLVFMATPILSQSAKPKEPPLVSKSGATPTVRALRLATPTTLGGKEAIGVVTLSAKAPAGGATVALTCDAPLVVSLPAKVTVPAGRTSAPFTIRTKSVKTPRNVVIRSVGGKPLQATLQIRPPSLSQISFTEESVKGGDLASGIILLDAPALSDTAIALSCNDSSSRLEEAKPQIKAGETRVTFTLRTPPVIEPKLIEVTATSEGVKRSATVTATPK